jgi:hypothetical protein
MLADNGADVQMANGEGRTALIAAGMHGDTAMAKFLLQRGADRSHRDQKGKTALDYAREEGQLELVGLLSER